MSSPTPQIDLSYLREISGNDPGYMSEVMGIFIDTMKTGLPKLGELVMGAGDFAEIQKQAHFLKSSASIVKIGGVYENLIIIDNLSKQKADLPGIKQAYQIIEEKYNEALPVLNEERIDK